MFESIRNLLVEKQTPTEVLGWILEFNRILDTKGPTGIVHGLVQMGIHEEGKCGCTESELEDAVFAWCHANHKFYNTKIWGMIVSRCGLMRKLRRVIETDLRSPDQTLGTDEAFGKIVLKSYGRELLQFFLTLSPDPKWVDAEAVRRHSPRLPFTPRTAAGLCPDR